MKVRITCLFLASAVPWRCFLPWRFLSFLLPIKVGSDSKIRTAKRRPSEAQPGLGRAPCWQFLTKDQPQERSRAEFGFLLSLEAQLLTGQQRGSKRNHEENFVWQQRETRGTC